jgi:large subunit ribosomal protein L19
MNMASLVETKKNPKIPNIAPGDTVRVNARIVEGGKERIQVYQGVVLKLSGGGPSASFTVRHVAFGIGVERTFQMNSTLVESVEIVRQGKVRRARLYYLRGLSGKEARRKIKRVERKMKQVGEELLTGAAEEVVEPMPAEPVAEQTAATAAPAAEAPKAPEAVKAPAAEKPAAKEAPKAEKPAAAKESPPAPPAAEEKK